MLLSHGRTIFFCRVVFGAGILAPLLVLLLTVSSRAGNLTGSGSASVSTGDSYDFVYGRRVQGGDAVADGSVVSVTGGSVSMDLYGGSALSRNGTAEANDNQVTITGGMDGFDYTVYGGYARSYVGNAEASGNSVNISGPLNLGPWATVYGGYARLSGGTGRLESSGNSVSLRGSSALYLVVGGEAYGESSSVSESFATGNTVTADGVSVGLLYGGYAIASGDATASGNTVNIYGGEFGPIVGGDAHSVDGAAVADDNRVNMFGGTSLDVIGASIQGDTGSATAFGNTVSLKNATVNGSVAGAFAPESTVAVRLRQNTVIVQGGATVAGNVVGAAVTGTVAESSIEGNIVTVADGGIVEGNVVGGSAEGEGSADGNTVFVRNAFVGGNVTGGETGEGGTASGNSVIVGEGASFSSSTVLFGGMVNGGAVSSAGSGNTLFVDSWQGSVSRVAGFENLHFVLPAPGASVEVPMLTVTDAESGDFSGSVVTAQLPDIITGGRAYLGSSFVLISDDSGAVGQAKAGELVSLQQGYATLFEGVLKNTGTSVQLELVEERMNPRIAALTEARAASAGLLNQGGDLAADAGMYHACEAVRRSGGNWTPFAAISGGFSRYHTGSHVDTEGFSGLTGLAGRTDVAGGNLMLGGFFEFGRAHLDTFNDFTSGDVNGRGSSRYTGAGILARVEGEDGFLDGWYAEAVWRMGQAGTSWYSGDLRDNMDRPAEYDLSNLYYGGHAGLGHVFALSGTLSLDVYGRFFWTRQESDDENMNGEEVHFDSVDSRRLRGGMRLALEMKEGVSPYAGAAWEYEFGGSAHAVARDFSIPDASLEGGSALFELGLEVTPCERPFSLDVGLVGSAGERDSVGGRLNVLYRF